MKTIVAILGVLRPAAEKLGPYLLLEMLLPGGTLLALLIFLYRRSKGGLPDSAA